MPYLSASEEIEWARRFAQGAGDAIWQAEVPRALAAGVKHRSCRELLGLLKGRGKGDAAWPSAYEVLRARAYVEEKLEHLFDFRDIADKAVGHAVTVVFEKV